ncbi:MAG: phosphoribosyltransferase [Myxococcota bacterium]
MVMERYRNRQEAGRILADRLADHAGERDVFVLALPRGGVPVAAVVAEALDAPLDVLLVRKLGVPGHGELAMGAIASGGARVMNRSVVRGQGISEAEVERVEDDERRELRRREEAYRGDRPFPDLDGKTVILVDDGVATGATMKAAIEALRQYGPRRIVAAVPVAPAETVSDLRSRVDEVVCPRTPAPFFAIGQWYADFGQTTDQEVRQLLGEAWERRSR